MNNRPALPETVRGFIRQVVRTTWGLEILLLMRASAPRTWTSFEISAEIRANVPLVDEVLTTLVHADVVSRNEQDLYVFAPGDRDREKTIDELARLNQSYPFVVLKEIVRVPNEKIQTFVDAFRLKKD